MRVLLLSAACVVAVSAQTNAQVSPTSRAAQQGDTTKSAQPKTKLEAFQTRSGSVIVMGFESTGEIKCSEYGGSVTVEATELTDAASGHKEYGINVEVDKYNERTAHSYVDADEIESLLKGFDYVAKADRSVTPLANFQADYRTRGDLKISTFNSKDRVLLAVQPEAPYGSTCYLNLDQAPVLRTAIVKARDRIDAIKGK